MSGKYWDEPWNPVAGCTKCSPGCENCWAEEMAVRQYCMGVGRKGNAIQKYGSVIHEAKWNGKVFCDESVLDKPLHWRKPRTIFVCNMADLFHPDVPFEFIDKVVAVGALCPQHTLLMLTKRIERMDTYFDYTKSSYEGACNIGEAIEWINDQFIQSPCLDPCDWDGDLPNIWLGVTVCNQAEADEKIPQLLQIPAAHRWVSIEPMLGEIDLYLQGQTKMNWGSITTAALLDWVVVGAESGKKARYCPIENIRDIVEQCKAAGVPVFVKQVHLGPKEGYILSKDMADWPADLQVREKPKGGITSEK